MRLGRGCAPVITDLAWKIAAMPFLDASALENDLEGVAVLREVIGERAGRSTPSWGSILPRRPTSTRGHRAAAAALGATLRLFAFAALIAVLAHSRAPRPNHA